MLVLLFGVTAIVSTVVLGAYGSDSWLRCWEGVGEIGHEMICDGVDFAPYPQNAAQTAGDATGGSWHVAQVTDHGSRVTRMEVNIP